MAAPFYQYIEIEDPETKRCFYANISTGECRWERPEGATIKEKETNDNEWWELFDEKHKRPYYHNLKSRTTVWKKPENGLVIPTNAITQKSLPRSPIHEETSMPELITNVQTLYINSIPRNEPNSASAYSASTNPPTAGLIMSYQVPPVGQLYNEDLQQISALPPTPEKNQYGHSSLEQLFTEPSQCNNIHQSLTLQIHLDQPNLDSKPLPKSPMVPPSPRQEQRETKYRSLPLDLKENIHQFRLENFAKKYFSEHRKGLLRRKVPIEKMLDWQKDSLKQPLMVLNKNFHRDAIKCFKLIQKIMGNRVKHFDNSGTNSLEDIQLLLDRGIMVGGLRDEIYLQICKQLTNHPDGNLNVSPGSTGYYKGWLLLCVVVVAFPPSKNLDNYMRTFIQKGFLIEIQSINILAIHAMKIYERIAKTGPRGKTLSIQEIKRAQEAPFSTSVFGETLEDIMANQEESVPGLGLPRILPFLADAILALGGCKTEGIFRVPGDIDGVQDLKCRIENGNYDYSGIADPNVPSSLLKFWLRDLASPVIPMEYYNACISVGGEESQSNAPLKAKEIVDSLPGINKAVLNYMIRFLRIVGEVGNQKYNKMTIANIAMVFSPNFLRCPSDDPAVIFENTKLSYIRL